MAIFKSTNPAEHSNSAGSGNSMSDESAGSAGSGPSTTGKTD